MIKKWSSREGWVGFLAWEPISWWVWEHVLLAWGGVYQSGSAGFSMEGSAYRPAWRWWSSPFRAPPSLEPIVDRWRAEFQLLIPIVLDSVRHCKTTYILHTPMPFIRTKDTSPPISLPQEILQDLRELPKTLSTHWSLKNYKCLRSSLSEIRRGDGTDDLSRAHWPTAHHHSGRLSYSRDPAQVHTGKKSSCCTQRQQQD